MCVHAMMYCYVITARLPRLVVVDSASVGLQCRRQFHRAPVGRLDGIDLVVVQTTAAASAQLRPAVGRIAGGGQPRQQQQQQRCQNSHRIPPCTARPESHFRSPIRSVYVRSPAALRVGLLAGPGSAVDTDARRSRTRRPAAADVRRPDVT